MCDAPCGAPPTERCAQVIRNRLQRTGPKNELRHSMVVPSGLPSKLEGRVDAQAFAKFVDRLNADLDLWLRDMPAMTL